VADVASAHAGPLGGHYPEFNADVDVGVGNDGKGQNENEEEHGHLIELRVEGIGPVLDTPVGLSLSSHLLVHLQKKTAPCNDS